jgi:ligand-binding sensor domain-containing protein
LIQIVENEKFDPVNVWRLGLILWFSGYIEKLIGSETLAGSGNASAAEVKAPVTIQDLEKSASADPFSSQQTLVIDLDSKAEIGGVVRCVFQDSRGVLWVGGEGDLFRNDGKTVTSYDIKDDLGNRVTVRQIIEDHAGHIWCATTGGITRIEGKSFTSFGEKDGLLSRSVWSIAADKDSIWIGTIEGVCRFECQGFTEFSIPESTPDPTRGVTSAKIVHCIVVDRAGRVWFGTNGGAYIDDGKFLTNLSTNDGLPDDVGHNIWKTRRATSGLGPLTTELVATMAPCSRISLRTKSWRETRFGALRRIPLGISGFPENDLECTNTMERPLPISMKVMALHRRG